MGASTEVKITSDNGASFTVAGYAVVFGGQDLVGDAFSSQTDFWFDRLSQTPPVLYQHGQDEVIKRAVVGRVVAKRTDDVGLWIEAQITAAKQYADAIRDLVRKGVLGWSSGSVPHLVQRVKSAVPGVTDITSWPIVEVSLTPTPAEPRTVGVKELKALAERDPWLLDFVEEAEKAEVTTDARHHARPTKGGVRLNDLPDAAFAHIAPGGTLDEERKTVPRASRHVPHHAEDGTVDMDAVKSFLSHPTQEHGEKVIAHMMWHARQEGLLEPFGFKAVPDADLHDDAYINGAPGAYLAAALKYLSMADSGARDRQAMERAGMDSHDGLRLYPRAHGELKAAIDRLNQVVKQADEINRGEDGAALVSQYLTEFEFLDLEEVA